MSKKRPLIDPKKLERFHSITNFTPVRRFEHSELVPILNRILPKNNDEQFRTSLTNYLIIRTISMFENYMSNKAQQLVDKADLDITTLFKEEIVIPTSLFNVVKEQVTKGKIVGMSYNFANLDDVNEVFSKLLNINYFDEVLQRHNNEDQMNETFRYFDGAIEICKNWKNVKKMFELRNDIVHGMAYPKLSNRVILSFVDSLMVFMDYGTTLIQPESQFVQNLIKNRTQSS